ncbi:putative uncharacterized protein DDB_G0282133 [Papaver somniferum]|uniref:putative uncharacterized protein DDB_G0282133 n=1 Tax=Papaver somniferum TaxID=3469 RepID=UPI000E701F14|nr:putative uncharacterized protein DDB_G0282133 [Papaver somniferum]
MMINAIKNPIGCFKNSFNNFELQKEAELLKNQSPSNVYYPNTRNNNNLLISTTNYSYPLTNTSFNTNTNTNTNTTNSANDISYLFQQEDHFNTTNTTTTTDNLNNSNTNPLYPYCSSYSSYTNDYDDDYRPILSTFSSLPVDNEVMIPFNDYEFNTPASTYTPSLKRQRPCVDPLPSFPPSDHFAFNNNDGCYSNPMSNCCCPNSQVDQFLLPSPTNTTGTTTTANEVSIAQPAYANYGGVGFVETSNGKKSDSRYLSAQSVAARERRRKISEKTQQLGKLVPGGSKLNTAEMFHAAYKYIKFLQAQIGALEFMGSVQENKMDCLTPHLGVLLASLPIQEKLYAEEKCLVSSRCGEIMRMN